MSCLAVPYIIFWYHHPLQTNTTVLGYTTCMAMFQNIARLKTSKAIKILYQEMMYKIDFIVRLKQNLSYSLVTCFYQPTKPPPPLTPTHVKPFFFNFKNTFS